MKRDRFLIGILIGIGVLVVVALVMFFVRKPAEYIPDDTPEGVVHNYVLALYRGDYQRAYVYLAEKDHKPNYQQFQESFMNSYLDPGTVGVEIVETKRGDTQASVSVNIISNASDPFSSRYSNPDKALLVLQDGKWKLTQMPYPFWDYNWYQEPPK
jgi:hypothetical protein